MLRDIPKYETIRKMSERIPEIDPGAVEAYLVTLKVSGDLFDALTAHFARHGTSQGRFMVMMALFKEAGAALSPADLSEKIGVTRPTITGLLDGLERDGYIKRVQSETDRRKTIVSLTRAGHDFLRKMLPDHFRRVAGLMAGLNDKEQKILARLLMKVSDGIPSIRDPEGVKAGRRGKVHGGKK